MIFLAYANGQVLRRILPCLDDIDFAGIIDKNSEEEIGLRGLPIWKPEQMNKIVFDYIIVFSKKYYQQIVEELSNSYQIDKNRIIRYDKFIDGWWYNRISAKDKQYICDEAKNQTGSIYIVAHKPYDMIRNSLYQELAVGAYQSEFGLTDHNGDNIAHLNDKINECTAIYWVWKNCKTDYVGFNHYRRCFYTDDAVHEYYRDENTNVFVHESLLQKETIENYLKEYDIILPKHHFSELNILDEIRNTTDQTFAVEVYCKLLFLIRAVQPQYEKAFHEIMDGHIFYPCNMFVTNWDVFSAYCEWLFSFLIPLAEQVDVSGYDAYSSRMIGFFAERMLTIWLKMNPLKIKELSYTQIIER